MKPLIRYAASQNTARVNPFSLSPALYIYTTIAISWTRSPSPELHIVCTLHLLNAPSAELLICWTRNSQISSKPHLVHSTFPELLFLWSPDLVTSYTPHLLNSPCADRTPISWIAHLVKTGNPEAIYLVRCNTYSYYNNVYGQNYDQDYVYCVSRHKRGNSVVQSKAKQNFILDFCQSLEARNCFLWTSYRLRTGNIDFYY